VVVLLVEGEHVVEEREFAVGHAAEGVDDGVAVVPDLVVLEVDQRGGVEPGDFAVEVGVEREEGAGAVDPAVRESGWGLARFIFFPLVVVLFAVLAGHARDEQKGRSHLTTPCSAPDSS
jgi:hypothetical protein